MNKLKFELENQNRWILIDPENSDPSINRVKKLLNLSLTSEKTKDGILFPFFPYKISGYSYTFFDLTRDRLKYFNWLRKIKNNEKIILESVNPSTGNTDLENIALICDLIALRNETCGGFLVHGIMLKYQEKAIILAGPSGIGKTTAACKMSDHWEICSDDLTLIVKGSDNNNNYYAHPWPGSKAYRHNEIRYNASCGVRLKNLFFIIHNTKVRIEKVNVIRALAMLKGVAEDAMALPDPSIDPKNVGVMIENRFHNLAEFVQKVPIYELHLNKTDLFGKEIEKLL